MDFHFTGYDNVHFALSYKIYSAIQKQNTHFTAMRNSW